MRVLIIGALGQDGSILAELYRSGGHDVLGVVRSPVNEARNMELLNVDLSDPNQANIVLNRFKPDRIFHLAAVHFSSAVTEVDDAMILRKMRSCHVGITQNVLEWQQVNLGSRFVVSLSSQMYSAEKSGSIVDEYSMLDPKNEYARTKVEAFERLRTYRDKYATQSFGAILFNHTSSRSKPEFLFPQMAHQIARVLSGEASKIVLRDPSAEIDICHAEDICQGLVSLAELSQPVDVVFSSGVATKIQTVVENTLRRLSYSGNYEIAATTENIATRSIVIGNSGRALRLLGWKPNRTPDEILTEMVLESMAKPIS
jgi:GDP-D-mannose dehydratase